MDILIEELLRKKNLTTYRVSKDTGIPQSTISNWINGKFVPNAKNLKILADYLGVTMEQLLGGQASEQK